MKEIKMKKMFIAIASVVLLASCTSTRPTLREKRDQAVFNAQQIIKEMKGKVVVVGGGYRVVFKEDKN